MKLTKKQILTLVDIVTKRIDWLQSLEEPNKHYVNQLQEIMDALLSELQHAPTDEPVGRLKKVARRKR